MKAADWIDRVKTTRGWDSDYRVAKELKFTPNTISNYRAAPRTMDEEISIKVAHALEIDPALVLADQALERAKNDEARSAWADVLKKLGGVAATIFVAAGMTGGMGGGPDAHAAQRSQNNSAQDTNTLYIVLN